MENGAGVPNGAAAAAIETPPMTVVREQDRLMPIANVIRIMRRVLPTHAKISDEAKELIQECVSEFISFITGEANEWCWCHAEHRKTVTAEDVVWAMDRLGFDDYVVPLSVFLERMRVCEAGGEGRAAVATRAPPTAHGNGVQMQIQRAVYAPPVPVQGYSVTMAPIVQATVVSPRVLGGGQGSMFGRERAVVGDGRPVNMAGLCNANCPGDPVRARYTSVGAGGFQLSNFDMILEALDSISTNF